MIDVPINRLNNLISQDEYLMILGPTASGKTALAFELAKKGGYDLISLDSRQVYRFFDIVTGKDIPSDFRFFDRRELSYYLSPSGFRIYGLSIISPNQVFNLAELIKLLPRWWQEIISRHRQVIFVGGTLHWFYRLLTTDYADVFIPQNEDWRSQAGKMTVDRLQKELIKIDPLIKQRLTNSDWLNKYRLIRWYERLTQPAIEIKENTVLRELLKQPRKVILLDYPLEALEERIKKRIDKRLKQGAILETKKLLRKYPIEVTAFNSPGYRQLIAFEKGLITQDELKKSWLLEEIKLVKKQKTWLKKIISFVDFKIKVESHGNKRYEKPADERPGR